MQSRLLKKMCCPFDKGDLNISIFKQEENEIIEGLLTCSDCQRYFPIIYGIPIMTPDEYRQKSLEAPVMKKWGLELPAGDQSFRLDGPATARALEMGDHG